MSNSDAATMNGAQVILKMLELHGVKHVFGLPGETTIGWYREWKAHSDIKYVLTRDERTASYAAEAYAKITGRPSVLEAPSPGVTHCTPGITEAYLSSVPIIFFSSDTPINQDKKHGLTGIDQTALYQSIPKESFVLAKVQDIPFLMRRAFRVATSGRPAPVHIRVPINVFHEEAEIDDLYAESDYSVYPAHRPVADHAKTRTAIELLQIPLGTTTPVDILPSVNEWDSYSARYGVTVRFSGFLFHWGCLCCVLLQLKSNVPSAGITRHALPLIEIIAQL